MGKLKKWEDYKGRDYIIVIPSRKRQETAVKVQELFPNAVFLVHEREAEGYLRNSKLDVLTHKKDTGYGSVMNEVFVRCKEQKIKFSAVFCDDKVGFKSLVGNRPRDLNSNQIEDCIVNGCQVLEDLNSHMYLFSTTSEKNYNQGIPFKIGFEINTGAAIYRNDKINKFRVGLHYYQHFNFNLEYVKKHEYYVTDMRTLCISGEQTGGGFESYQTEKAYEKALEYLENKWGDSIVFKDDKEGFLVPELKRENKKFKKKNK